MLVYGDHQKVAGADSWALDVDRQLRAIEAMPPGVGRHSMLVGALVDAGMLLQAVADREFEKSRCDRRSGPTDQLSALVASLGSAVCRSWDSEFSETGELPRFAFVGEWRREVELRVPEGFAFYCVYPEAFIEASRRLELVGPPRVIGIRSIGTSLAAVVAAALGAPPPISVRPFGDPFAREIAIHPALEFELADDEAHYVIVDEGPGQSGSSFGAVADWLQERNVPARRIAVLPSHSGEPGRQATDERRSWWRNLQKEVADFGDDLPVLLGRWSTSLWEWLEETPRDISAGSWRQVRYANEGDWPASVPAWERRKFLVRVGSETFFLKFAGLGRIGEEKLAIARALYSQELVPEPIGLVHGFLVERWCETAEPLTPHDKPVREIGKYITARKAVLPANDSGASVEELLAMARRNISVEFGGEAASRLWRWEPSCCELERRIHRVRTDNKLDRHEWLRGKSGELIKTDALDHHCGHDLIGCQDVAWDVAGAIVEFDLDQDESTSLVEQVETHGCSIDRAILEFASLAYLAFRVGQMRLGAAITSAASERQRLEQRGNLYSARLLHLLETSGARDSALVLG